MLERAMNTCSLGRPKRGGSDTNRIIHRLSLTPCCFRAKGAHWEGPAVNTAIPLDRYGEVLADYLESPGEQALYEASLVSQDLVHRGVGPEEIVALHMEALDQT